MNKYNDERQTQLRNIQKVNEVIFSARVGKATLEMLRSAGNPFQHDSAGKLIPGREPYHSDFIPEEGLQDNRRAGEAVPEGVPKPRTGNCGHQP